MASLGSLGSQHDLAKQAAQELKQAAQRRHCALQQQCEFAEQNKDGRRKGRRAQGKKLVLCHRCLKDFCCRGCLRKHTVLPGFDCPGASEDLETSSGGTSLNAYHGFAGFGAAATHGVGAPGGPARLAADPAAAAAAVVASGSEWLQQSLQVLWDCHHRLSLLVPEPLRAAGLLQGLGFVAQALILQGPMMMQQGGAAPPLLPGMAGADALPLPPAAPAAFHLDSLPGLPALLQHDDGAAAATTAALHANASVESAAPPNQQPSHDDTLLLLSARDGGVPLPLGCHPHGIGATAGPQDEGAAHAQARAQTQQSSDALLHLGPVATLLLQQQQQQYASELQLQQQLQQQQYGGMDSATMAAMAAVLAAHMADPAAMDAAHCM